MFPCTNRKKSYYFMTVAVNLVFLAEIWLVVPDSAFESINLSVSFLNLKILM